MAKQRDSVTVTVPGTTSNLGPGFDCFGVALSIANRVRVRRGGASAAAGMIGSAATAFFNAAGRTLPFDVTITGDVPRSRGLGSSVTVRAGVILGLNALEGEPLTQAECMNLVCALEGHPDNAVPAVLGGFTASSESSVFRAAVPPRLKFVTVIPEVEIETDAARAVLPRAIPLADAVVNVQGAAIIAAAFASGRYALLEDAFADRLHQPYREPLLKPFPAAVAAGRKAGALGGYLSGSGSTVICLTLRHPDDVGRAMTAVFRKAGIPARHLVLTADNTGSRIAAR
jgi:homoserine kinase